MTKAFRTTQHVSQNSQQRINTLTSAIDHLQIWDVRTAACIELIISGGDHFFAVCVHIIPLKATASAYVWAQIQTLQLLSDQ